MLVFYDLIENFQAFINAGGQVLWAIFALTFLLWTLLIERFWYFQFSHKGLVRSVKSSWGERTEVKSWCADKIRNRLIAEISIQVNRNLSTIKTLIAMCPLLGLLGTVTGMITVFDVLAVTGTGSPRAMAAGITRATIPTMTGLVAALSGLYFSTLLDRRAKKEVRLIADELHQGLEEIEEEGADKDLLSKDNDHSAANEGAA